jgi:hypothetical protein
MIRKYLAEAILYGSTRKDSLGNADSSFSLLRAVKISEESLVTLSLSNFKSKSFLSVYAS